MVKQEQFCLLAFLTSTLILSTVLGLQRCLMGKVRKTFFFCCCHSCASLTNLMSFTVYLYRHSSICLFFHPWIFQESIWFSTLSTWRKTTTTCPSQRMGVSRRRQRDSLAQCCLLVSKQDCLGTLVLNYDLYQIFP